MSIQQCKVFSTALSLIKENSKNMNGKKQGLIANFIKDIYGSILLIFLLQAILQDKMANL